MADAVIKQGTTRVITITKFRDNHQQPLDPTGWDIHAVARTGIWGPEVAVWRDAPTGDEGLAEVVPADTVLDPTAGPDDKWIILQIPAGLSQEWTWADAILDVRITEPSTGRQETFTARVHVDPTTIRP